MSDVTPKGGLTIEYRNTSDLIPYANNSRTHNDEQINQIASSIKEFGFTNPVLIDEQDGIIAGHGRLMAANKLELDNVPTITLTGLSDAQRKAYVIADNKLALNAGWDNELLSLEIEQLKELDFDIDLLGFDADELAELLPEVEQLPDGESVSLADKFLVPPFSVLNARDGWWQKRKKWWIELGIKSELGRDGVESYQTSNTDVGNKISAISNGTSVFDPVVCELVYSWFCPDGGIVLDPFAGGSVRGVVASKLGRQYIGCELRQEQVSANQIQANDICDDPMPVWHTTDSRLIDSVCSDVKADLLFSCPPYADLEVYSDDPNDLSTLKYDEFAQAYRDIIAKSCSLLKDNSFACFVVGEVRDKKGNYYNFVGDTVKAFVDVGLNYYNEAILVTQVGTVAMTSERPFKGSRKLGKTHQNVLVFCKGDPKKATANIGEVSVYIPEDNNG